MNRVEVDNLNGEEIMQRVGAWTMSQKIEESRQKKKRKRKGASRKKEEWKRLSPICTCDGQQDFALGQYRMVFKKGEKEGRTVLLPPLGNDSMAPITSFRFPQKRNTSSRSNSLVVSRYPSHAIGLNRSIWPCNVYTLTPVCTLSHTPDCCTK